MAQSNWEADKMLDVYIYDYLLKRNLHDSAKAFMAEGKVSGDPVDLCGFQIECSRSMADATDRSFLLLKHDGIDGYVFAIFVGVLGYCCY